MGPCAKGLGGGSSCGEENVAHSSIFIYSLVSDAFGN